MKLPIVTLFSALLLAAQAIAQAPASADSLSKVINGNGPAPEKIKACIALSSSLVVKDFDWALETARNGLQLAQAGNDKPAAATLQKNIGLAYYFKGNYDSAAVYYYQALDQYKTVKDPEGRAALLNELGKLYRKTRDLDRSLQFYDEAYAIYKSIGSNTGMATILNESGVVFEYREDYKEAIHRYQQSLDICNRIRDTAGASWSINFIGGAYTQMKNYGEAEKYLLDALQMRLALKDSFAIALNYTDLAYMYAQQGKYDKAIEQYQLSNSIANRMKYADLLQNNYKELAAIAEKQGHYQQSLEYTKLQATLRDSVYSSDKMKQIEQLNARYQAEKKEQQLQLQQAVISKKNYLLLFLGGSLALLAIAGFALYRKRQLQHRVQLQDVVMKQQDMATRAVITAEENERQRIAADLHDGVGQMMSAAKMNLSAFEDDLPFTSDEQKLAYEKIMSLVDESCREIRNVSHQMMPNALLKSGLSNAIREFIDKIDSRVIRIQLHAEGLNDRLDSNVETVLYRVIQECVNNVIKHAGADRLDIALIRDEDGISATIEDNGKGFDSGKKSEGIGLQNIRSRIAFLKGTVDFDSAPGRGTLVAIHVPLSNY